MYPHLIEMFGLNGENSPDWDTERKYRADDLQVGSIVAVEKGSVACDDST